MEMIQQLFMVAFAAFVFSILVEKLACVSINGEEGKSKRTKYKRTQNNSTSTSTSKRKKKVHFAVHDQIATVINKLVKLGAIKRPMKQQMFKQCYDLSDVYLGTNWIGEELMIYKELGVNLEQNELGFGTIQVQIKTLDDMARTGFASDDQIEDETNENIELDFAPIKFVN